MTTRSGGVARRFLPRILPVLAVALVTSASADCAGPMLACTDMGCPDGLSVRVVDDLDVPATVRVTADGEERSFQCDPAYACMGFFDGWMPVQVDVVVEWEGGSFSTSAEPVYDPVYPNGRRCGAVCTQGAVKVSVP